MCEEEKKIETETAETAAPETTPSVEEAVAEYKDKLLRLTAEFDNFRKRTAKEKETLFSDGRADCVMEFLPFVDNMERFMEAMQEEAEDSPLRQGLEKVVKQLSEILKSLTVEEIPAVGEKFDPNLHNAVMHVEDDKVDEATVVEQFQKGYTMGGKVLRFSMVKVAN